MKWFALGCLVWSSVATAAPVVPDVHRSIRVESSDKSGPSSYERGVEAYRVGDFAAARRHWETSISEGGDPYAFNNLGYLVAAGKGGEQDYARAFRLWTQGAKLGVSEAQRNLGTAFELGHGTEIDLMAAAAWYRCAMITADRAAALSLSRGIASLEGKIGESARHLLSKLLERLKPTEIEASVRLSDEYLKKYARHP